MSKRARLAGGLGDINPQILTMTTGLAGAQDDYVVNQINLPVARIGGSKNKAIVMEVLSVAWYLSLVNSNDPTSTDWGFLSTNTNRFNAETATLAEMELDAVDPLTFAMVYSHRGVSTNGGNNYFGPYVYDATDGEGNGTLIATDRIFIVGGNVAGAGGGSYIAKVTYRMKEVGIQEYVGIVQSQQA